MFSLIVSAGEYILFQKNLKLLALDSKKILVENIEFYKEIYFIYHKTDLLYVLAVDDHRDLEYGNLFLKNLVKKLEEIWKPLNSSIFLLEIDKIATVIDDLFFYF